MFRAASILTTDRSINSYLDRAILVAQRAGVVVHSIYFQSAGHFGHSLWQINWGRTSSPSLPKKQEANSFGRAFQPVSFVPISRAEPALQ